MCNKRFQKFQKFLTPESLPKQDNHTSRITEAGVKHHCNSKEQRHDQREDSAPTNAYILYYLQDERDVSGSLQGEP